MSSTSYSASEDRLSVRSTSQPLAPHCGVSYAPMVTMSYWPAPEATSAVTAARRSPSSITWKLTVVPGLADSYSDFSCSMSFIWPLLTVARLRVTLPPSAASVPSSLETAPDEHAASAMADASAPAPSVSMRFFAYIPNSFGRCFLWLRPSAVRCVCPSVRARLDPRCPDGPPWRTDWNSCEI